MKIESEILEYSFTSIVLAAIIRHWKERVPMGNVLLLLLPIIVKKMTTSFRIERALSDAEF